MTLSESQIRRYARHVLLPDVGGIGQRRLLDATVAIDLDRDRAAAIAAASYLAAAGVGSLVLVGGAAPVTEDDVATGIGLGLADVGRPLADALARRLRAQNPDVAVTRGIGAPITFPASEQDGVAGALIRGGLAAAHTVTAIVSGNRTA